MLRSCLRGVAFGALIATWIGASGRTAMAASSNGNTVTISGTTKVVGFGDSITDPAQIFQWPSTTGGLLDQIAARFTQPTANPYAVATGGVATVAASVTRATCTPVAPTPKTVNYSSVTNLTATSGWTSGQLLAQLSTALSTTTPNVILLHIGINDVSNGGSPVSPYQSNVNSILDTIHTFDPTIKVIVVGLMAHWEKWDNVTGWNPGPNTDDASLATANTFLAGLPASRSYVTYIDVRNALLVGEQANNTSPVVGSTVGVQDGVYIYQDTHGVHPNPNLKVLMGTQVMPFIQVTP